MESFASIRYMKLTQKTCARSQGVSAPHTDCIIAMVACIDLIMFSLYCVYIAVIYCCLRYISMIHYHGEHSSWHEYWLIELLYFVASDKVCNKNNTSRRGTMESFASIRYMKRTQKTCARIQGDSAPHTDCIIAMVACIYLTMFSLYSVYIAVTYCCLRYVRMIHYPGEHSSWHEYWLIELL